MRDMLISCPISLSQVSRKICDLYHKCCSGNEESIRTFLAAHSLPPPPSLPPSVTPPQTVCDMEDGEGSKMEEDSATVDEVLMEGEGEGEGEEEGGWEVVRKPRRRSRN